MTESNPPETPSNLPGDPAFPADLPARLQAALAAKGSAYEPRTHHLQPGGAPTFTNRLILETSPYLLQHAHNPVNWYPWGDEAFADARRLGRPVFLSIGYSTCHWCHVMEEESFEDEEIAAFLNAALHPDQGRPRGAPRRRRHLHERRAGADRVGRLADERLADPRARAVLRRHLLSRRATARAARASAS